MYRENLSGRTIGGYKLVQRIGHGGMSNVYLAQRSLFRRKVALKLLWLGTRPYPRQIQLSLARFKREAEIISRLHHDNIITVHDYGETGPYAFLVMPYFEGGSLAALLAQQKVLTIQQTCTYLQQIASGLDHAHSKHIVHRDLKPENFLLSQDLSQLVIADFGISRITSSSDEPHYPTLTQNGTVLGTYQYMAPENFRDHATVDYRADIYSLGIVLYQLLSGTLPFDGDLYTVVENHKYTPLPWLSTPSNDIPFAVDLVLQKATHKDPALRHRSTTELAQEFAQAICLSTDNGPTISAPSRSHSSSTLLTRSSSGIPPTPLAPTRSAPSLPPQSTAHTRPAHTHAHPLIDMIPVIGLFVAIAVLFIVGHLTANANVQAHLPGSTQKAAIQSINHYFQEVDNHDYPDAYALTTSTFQHDHPYPTFVAGYHETLRNTITHETSGPVSSTQATVTITDQATENRPSGIVTNTYVIRYTMTLDRGTWKIARGEIISATHNR